MSESLASLLFQYPETPHLHKHGPRGYTDYLSYKPWLRDEFDFRCVYCLCRERWFPVGDAAFSVDHLRPQSVAITRINDYDNLVYACCYCNSAKRDIDEILDPCVEAYGNHLKVADDGAIQGLTVIGDDLIDICQLTRPRLTEFRLRILLLCKKLKQNLDCDGLVLLGNYFGYPTNLPQLKVLRPSGGNARPNGVDACFFEKMCRNELSIVY